MAKILLKNLDESLTTKAVFILLELQENEVTRSIVEKKLKSQKDVIQAEFKKQPKATGLRLLLEKLKVGKKWQCDVTDLRP